MGILNWLIAPWRAPSQEDLDRDRAQPRVLVVDVCPLTYSYWAVEDQGAIRTQPPSGGDDRNGPVSPASKRV